MAEVISEILFNDPVSRYGRVLTRKIKASSLTPQEIKFKFSPTCHVGFVDTIITWKMQASQIAHYRDSC